MTSNACLVFTAEALRIFYSPERSMSFFDTNRDSCLASAVSEGLLRTVMLFAYRRFSETAVCDICIPAYNMCRGERLYRSSSLPLSLRRRGAMVTWIRDGLVHILFTQINCKKVLLFGIQYGMIMGHWKYGLLVKRLRRRPLTAETGVRFPYGSPCMFWINTVQTSRVNRLSALSALFAGT